MASSPIGDEEHAQTGLVGAGRVGYHRHRRWAESFGRARWTVDGRDWHPGLAPPAYPSCFARSRLRRAVVVDHGERSPAREADVDLTLARRRGPCGRAWFGSTL